MENLKEKTINGLAWGATNALLTQVMSALFGIFLARMLSPADYGLVGMLAIFSAIAGSLQESGFTAALTNLKQVTHRDYNAVFWFSTGVSVTLYAILFFSAPLIARFFGHPELTALSRVVFLAFVGGGIGIAHAAYMFRNMMNREKTIVGTVALVGSNAIGLTLAYNGFAYWSLAWQQLSYIVIVDCGRLWYVKWRPTLDVDFAPIRRMFGFSSKILLTNIINQLNSNILSFFFGKLFSAAAVGSYTQAAKWNQMGHSLISSTIQQVAQPVLASINDEAGRQLNVFRKMLRFTAFLSMPAMLGLALIADFFVLLLGNQWADSIPLLRILCLSGAFMPIVALYQNLFISHGRSDVYMWCTAAQVITQTAVILIFIAWDIRTMVTIYTLMLILWVVVWQVMAYREMRLPFIDVAKDILPFLLAAAVSVGVAYAVALPVGNIYISTAVRIVVTALLYIAIMKVSKARIFSECMDFVLRHQPFK